ncbi:MAG: DnaB-like helicase C-terminal domain-containing protein, partial [Kiritimatiellae bacterium]|nr:DnaB-like helicase C-terminal domain-containing protein [Kiritimatiellia bacterium]
RQIEVSMISQQIKAMAKELKVPVIVLSQLNRANEQRSNARGGDDRPKLSDLRDSGAIEQDADVVFLLWRPNSGKPEEQGMVVINVAKNRNGETGDVKVNFIREYVRFVDRPPERDDGQVNFTTSEPHEVYEQSRFEDTTI